MKRENKTAKAWIHFRDENNCLLSVISAGQEGGTKVTEAERRPRVNFQISLCSIAKDYISLLISQEHV